MYQACEDVVFTAADLGWVSQPEYAVSLPGLTGTGLKLGAYLSLSLLVGPGLNLAVVLLKIL